MSKFSVAQIEALEESGEIKEAELVITREEVRPIFSWLTGSDDGDFDRGSYLAVDLVGRLSKYFEAEPAALSVSFTRSSLAESIGYSAAADLFREIVTVKGEIIARRIREEREGQR